MPNGHFHSAGASIAHGDASIYFPVEELEAPVFQHRGAELALDEVDGDDVVVIAPTSMASGYFLTQHALTAIPVDGLPDIVRSELAEALEDPLQQFELIQIGKWRTNSPDHSLAEYSNA